MLGSPVFGREDLWEELQRAQMAAAPDSASPTRFRPRWDGRSSARMRLGQRYTGGSCGRARTGNSRQMVAPADVIMRAQDLAGIGRKLEGRACIFLHQCVTPQSSAVRRRATCLALLHIRNFGRVTASLADSWQTPPPAPLRIIKEGSQIQRTRSFCQRTRF